MTFRITDPPTPTDKNDIRCELPAYNLARLEDTAPKECGIFSEDAAGRCAAGLIGETHDNWLIIDFLWVREAPRGRGIALRLFKKRKSSRTGADVNMCFECVFFQNPGFYRRLSYEERFALETDPRTGKRHYFTKTLSRFYQIAATFVH